MSIDRVDTNQANDALAAAMVTLETSSNRDSMFHELSDHAVPYRRGLAVWILVFQIPAVFVHGGMACVSALHGSENDQSVFCASRSSSFTLLMTALTAL